MPSALGLSLGNSAQTRGPSMRYVGCGDPVASSARLEPHAAENARSRAAGLACALHCLNLGSSLEIRMPDVWYDTQRRTLTTVLMNPMW